MAVSDLDLADFKSSDVKQLYHSSNCQPKISVFFPLFFSQKLSLLDYLQHFVIDSHDNMTQILQLITLIVSINSFSFLRHSSQDFQYVQLGGLNAPTVRLLDSVSLGCRRVRVRNVSQRRTKSSQLSYVTSVANATSFYKGDRGHNASGANCLRG